MLAAHPLRDMVTPGPVQQLRVERERALCGAWYEVFPRSEGAWRDESRRLARGTLRTATDRRRPRESPPWASTSST